MVKMADIALKLGMRFIKNIWSNFIYMYTVFILLICKIDLNIEVLIDWLFAVERHVKST
jgi:hypothetical protein